MDSGQVKAWRSDAVRSELEIAKAINLLERRATPRVFHCPELTRSRIYRSPTPRYWHGAECWYCGRGVIGYNPSARCIECWQRDVRERFYEAVFAEERRADAFRQTFTQHWNFLMADKPGNVVQVVVRSIGDLRGVLLQEIQSLRSGKTDAERAKAVANLATAVLKSVDVEIKVRALREKDISGNSIELLPTLVFFPGDVVTTPSGKEGSVVSVDADGDIEILVDGEELMLKAAHLTLVSRAA